MVNYVSLKDPSRTVCVYYTDLADAVRIKKYKHVYVI